MSDQLPRANPADNLYLPGDIYNTLCDVAEREQGDSAGGHLLVTSGPGGTSSTVKTTLGNVEFQITGLLAPEWYAAKRLHGFPATATSAAAVSLPDGGEFLPASNDVAIENVGVVPATGHVLKIGDHVSGHYTGAQDQSTGLPIVRTDHRNPLAVGYDNCGAELVVQSPTDHLDFFRRHFSLYSLLGVANEVAVQWKGFDVEGMGYCTSGTADNVEGILFTDSMMPVAGTDYDVCFSISPTNRHRTSDTCGPDSLAPWALVTAKVTIPNPPTYYLPPYTPPTGTPPTITVIYPGGSAPPYLSTNGADCSLTLGGPVTWDGTTLSQPLYALTFTKGILSICPTGTNNVIDTAEDGCDS